MSFQNGTCTGYIDLLDKLEKYLTGNRVSAAAIVAGGAGYTVGDVLSVTGGTGTFVATLKVVTIAAGVITAIKVWTSGVYTVNPTNAVAVTGGTGAGATFNLTLVSGGWTTLRNATYATTEKEMIFQGVGSGSDAIYVGIRTYRDVGPDAFNWELAGMTGFATALAWNLQPGISPGRWDAASPVVDGGAFLPLDDIGFPFWFNVTGRRIIVVARPGTSYVQMYLGFINPYNTTTEWPYPLIVAASACQKETRFNSSRASLNSIIEPTRKFTGTSPSVCNGPVMVRMPDGVWTTIVNWEEAAGAATSTKTVHRTWNVMPPGGGDRQNNTGHADTVMLNITASWAWRSVRPETGVTPTYELRGVPSTPTNEVLLWPPTFVFSQNPVVAGMVGQILGQYDDVFWTSLAGAGLTSEDEITFGNESYIAFQGVNNANSFDFIALRRSF